MLDKQDAQKLVDNAKAVLVHHFSGWDISIVGQPRYNPEGYIDIKFRLAEEGVTKEYLDLMQVASMYGLDTEKIGDHGVLGKIKLIGYKTRARKYPFVVEQVDGKKGKYSIPETDAERLFG